MKLWAARNRSGSLLLFDDIPYLNGKCWLPQIDTEAYIIDPYLFPELTFEGSPQIVTINIKDESNTKFWIARNENDTLWVFDCIPFVSKNKYWYRQSSKMYLIDDRLFPEITFENSPMQVEFKLVDNGTRR